MRDVSVCTNQALESVKKLSVDTCAVSMLRNVSKYNMSVEKQSDCTIL